VASLIAAFSTVVANQSDAASTSHVTDAFALGWMLQDANDDEIADSVSGKIVVSANPTSEENAAAADVAARLGYETTGFTPPLVISAVEDRSDGPRIYIGLSSVPGKYSAVAGEYLDRLQSNEGGVLALDNGIVILGHDGAALLAAAEAYASRSPYIWRPGGSKLSEIRQVCGAGAEISGITYLKGRAGVQRVMLVCPARPSQTALQTALNTTVFASVHELVARSNGDEVSATSAKELPPVPPARGTGSTDDAIASTAPGEGPEAAGGPVRLDLATLYTMRGLFRGTPRMPVPSNLDSQLYVPAGPSGIAMANLAARMGLETTGITLPLAIPAVTAAPPDVRSKSVVEASSNVGREAARKFLVEDTALESKAVLAPGEGELRIVDKAFGRQPSVLIRGDEAGSSSALDLLSSHFPDIWDVGKQYASLEEIRYDLHRFFSLRSSTGQAAAALYRLERWADEMKKLGPAKDIDVKLYVDIAEPGLANLVRQVFNERVGAADVKVKVRSLHAGTQCCASLPALHYQEPDYQYHQGSPTFQEDLVFPWEGTRLLDAVRNALSKLNPGEPVKVVARVSEGPEQRQHLKAQIAAMLANVVTKGSEVKVLCAYKPGVSWLMDDIAPLLKGKPVASIRIEFRKHIDESETRAMLSTARWVHELYPVDEMLAKELGLPLSNIALAQFEVPGKVPTYRVHAYDKDGKEILVRDFNVTTVQQPYNGVMQEYENVEVDTGWVRMESGTKVVLDERIPTDIEKFWEHYHKVTLPRVFREIKAAYHGDPHAEFVPPFDTLKVDIHMSEPNYELGIDKERISSLEALQEDTFYSTENFVNMTGDLLAGRAFQYAGRIIPIVHASDEGKDARVRIEFYGKPSSGPQVWLRWTDSQGRLHEHKRDLWVLTVPCSPDWLAPASGPKNPAFSASPGCCRPTTKKTSTKNGSNSKARTRWSMGSLRSSRHAGNWPGSKRCMRRASTATSSPIRP
jgi:hypothetical protein